MPKQTWSTVKTAASSLSQKELLGLIGELYRLSSQNKAFLHARFADQGGAMEEFKAIVAECLYPDVSRDRPLRVAKAKSTHSGVEMLPCAHANLIAPEQASRDAASGDS